MFNFKIILLSFLIFVSIFTLGSCQTLENIGGYLTNRLDKGEPREEIEGEIMDLPNPNLESNVSLEEAIENRRSVRNFRDKDLDMEQISQLLWAAQGITEEATNFRAAPSAGALYPLELFVASKDGLFHYVPEGHKIEKLSVEDKRNQLMQCALFQEFIGDAPISIVITSVDERTTQKYGNRGIRYTHMEAGHAAQNILLQATALDLGAVPVGAFDDQCLLNLFKLPDSHTPLYIIPVGYIRE